MMYLYGALRMYLGECMEIKTPSPRGQSRSIVVGPFFFFSLWSLVD